MWSNLALAALRGKLRDASSIVAEAGLALPGDAALKSFVSVPGWTRPNESI